MQKLYVASWVLGGVHVCLLTPAVVPQVDKFVSGGYSKLKPEPFYHAPNSLVGRAKGAMLRCATPVFALTQSLLTPSTLLQLPGACKEAVPAPPT